MPCGAGALLVKLVDGVELLLVVLLDNLTVELLRSGKESRLGSPLVGGKHDSLQKLHSLQALLPASVVELLETRRDDLLILAEVLQVFAR